MVELHPELVDDRGRRHFVAVSQGRALGRVVMDDQGSQLMAATEADGAVSRAEWESLLAAVVAVAAAEQRSQVVLPAGSGLLLRHVARSAGFAGPLRGELRRDVHVATPVARPAISVEERFLADLRLFLPGMTVVASGRPAGWLRSALRSASAGVPGTVPLTVSDASGAKALWVAVPVGDDVMAESVAMVIDTAMAVRRRFHPLVDRVRVFFDQPIHGLRTGEIAGLAAAFVRDVHLNPAFARAGELEVFERQRDARRANPPPGQAPRRPPITVLPPFTRSDSVTAHEFWHQIEFGYESAHYRDSVEFRRALGGYFGVDTLEHVVRGGDGKAPSDWQLAFVRLATEVSGYATTNPKEATAELFTQWWCTAADPPPPARFFGQLMARFFPAGDRAG